MDTEDTPEGGRVASACKILLMVGTDAFPRALVEMKKIITLTDDQVAGIYNQHEEEIWGGSYGDEADDESSAGGDGSGRVDPSSRGGGKRRRTTRASDGDGTNQRVSADAADSVRARVHQVHNPYASSSAQSTSQRPLPMADRNPFSIATRGAAAAKRLGTSAGKNKKTASANKRGRPEGSTNKDGHKAGGARNTAKYAKPIPGQSQITSYHNSSGGGTGGGAGSGNSRDGGRAGTGGKDADDGTDIDEDEAQKDRDKLNEKRAEEARKLLEKYTSSVPNGSIGFAEASDTESESDCSDLEPNEDEQDDFDSRTTTGGAADGKKRSRRAYKPSKESVIHQYLDSICKRIAREDPSLNLI